MERGRQTVQDYVSTAPRYEVNRESIPAMWTHQTNNLRRLLCLVLLSLPLKAMGGCPTCTNPDLPHLGAPKFQNEMGVGALGLSLNLRGSSGRSTHQQSAALGESGAGDVEGKDKRAWDYMMVAMTMDVEQAISTGWGWAITVPTRFMSVKEDTSYGLDDSMAITQKNEHGVTHTGLGDVSLFAVGYLRANPKRAWSVTVRLGVTIPTGNTLPDPYAETESQSGHDHVFFGSGTVDPRVLLYFRKALGPLTLHLSAHYRSAFYANKHGYRMGMQTGGGMTLSSSLGWTDYRFSIGGEGVYESASQWEESGSKDLFSGRSGYVLSLEAARSFSDWELALGADFPIIVSTANGDFTIPFVAQLTARYML